MARYPIKRIVDDLEKQHGISYEEVMIIVKMHPNRKEIFEEIAITLKQDVKYLMSHFYAGKSSKNVLWLIFPIACKLKEKYQNRVEEIANIVSI